MVNDEPETPEQEQRRKAYEESRAKDTEQQMINKLEAENPDRHKSFNSFRDYWEKATEVYDYFDKQRKSNKGPEIKQTSLEDKKKFYRGEKI